MKNRFCLISLFLVSIFSFSQDNIQSKTLQLRKSTVKQIVAVMTLEEKASLVVGVGMPVVSSSNENGIVGNWDGKVQGAAGGSKAFPKFGIPGIIMADGPAGVRIDPIRDNDKTKTYYATAWPIGTSLASTWNADLVRNVGIAFGNEAREYGIDIILAPGMNIQRNPLNGRNFEYYSEDPLVTGFMGAAMVNGVQSNGVGTSIKHFAANNQETSRTIINANISERALREIYLRGFEIAVKKAQPLTVMSAYNKINGIYTPESYDLLTTILKDEWGFKGCVITDWGGGRDYLLQQKAGNDLIMPGSSKQIDIIVNAVKNRTLDVNVLDKNVERILKVALQTPSFRKYKYSDKPDLKTHATLSRIAATEGMVLLKNDNFTLPMKESSKIALYGNASYETIFGGTGSGEVYVAYSVSLAEGLKTSGFKPFEDIKTKYINYIKQDKIDYPKPKKTAGAVRMTPEMNLTADDVKNTIAGADYAIYTIGHSSGEGLDRKIDGDFILSDLEKTLIKNISESIHAADKKLVVVINVGGVIETASWRDYADAILVAWQPGQEAGNAISDVLSGKVNPSGKLAVTFPMKYEDVPSSKCFPGTPAKKPTEVIYEEGIYVGYRYYNSFDVKPAYEFGYGLSYTTFSYSGLKLSSSNFKNEITATVKITNTGKAAGKEVVQLYLSAPEKTLEKPSEELRAFAKTKLLKPGESQTLTFQLNARDLATFYTDQSSWIADGGNYTVKIGASSRDIKLTKQFSLAKDMVVEKVHKALTPQIEINELKKK
ncbi:glycoside hydrolase family 3 C-terminal domain-containing protein [Flavobacterium notoginsengisoli]